MRRQSGLADPRTRPACGREEGARVGRRDEPPPLTPILPIDGDIVPKLGGRLEKIVEAVDLVARVGHVSTSLHQGLEAVRLTGGQLGQQGDDRIHASARRAWTM